MRIIALQKSTNTDIADTSDIQTFSDANRKML